MPQAVPDLILLRARAGLLRLGQELDGCCAWPQKVL